MTLYNVMIVSTSNRVGKKAATISNGKVSTSNEENCVKSNIEIHGNALTPIGIGAAKACKNICYLP